MRIQKNKYTRIATVFGVLIFAQCCCCFIPLPLQVQEGLFSKIWQVPGWLAGLNTTQLFQAAAVLFLP